MEPIEVFPHLKKFRPSKKEVHAEAAPATEEEKAEVRRRAEIAGLCKKTAELQQELFTFAKRSEKSLEERMQSFETVEALQFGEEVDRHEIGELGVNQTTRRIYEGDPLRIAYVKPQNGELCFGKDAEGNPARITQKWDKQKGRFIEFANPHDLLEGEKEYVERSLKERPGIIAAVAAHYGITPEEVPLNPNELSFRTGIDPKKGAIREYIASSINELVRFGVVPLTVLRAEKDNTDIASVQEAVGSTDPMQPARPPTDEEFKDLLKMGPEHAGATSFMRIACLDYLIQSMDRHTGNILYDPVSHQFTGIDNGYSMALSRSYTGSDGKPTKKPLPLDVWDCVPIEVVGHHPEWKLDEAARQELVRLHDTMKEYLALRETAESSKSNESKGKEIKYITKLFRTLWGNEKIAAREAMEFMIRVKHIIDNGRPPDLRSPGILRPRIDDLAKEAQAEKETEEAEAGTLPPGSIAYDKTVPSKR